MPNDLKSLAIEYDAALAAGDRPRAIAIFRKIREVLGALSPEQLNYGLSFLKQLLEVFFPATAEAQTLATTFSADEVEALGFGDNAAQLIELITLVFTFIRRIRGA